MGFFLPLPICTLAQLDPSKVHGISVSCVLDLSHHFQIHGVCLLHPILPFSGCSTGLALHRATGWQMSPSGASQSLWEGAPSCLPMPGSPPDPLTGILISGSDPQVPALPGTGLSPAPSQSPSDHSLLLPLLAGCSWCHRCAGLGRRRGSGSTPAPVARWPRTAARDRERKRGKVILGARSRVHPLSS